MSFYHQDDCEGWPWNRVTKFESSKPTQETDSLGFTYTNKPEGIKKKIRLIDADALKEEFEREKELNPYYALFFDKVIAVIDNAPTVEEKSYAMGYQDGCEDGLQGIRPQGEWLQRWKEYECDKCGYFTKPLDNWLPNFCPTCGADMRGEKK